MNKVLCCLAAAVGVYLLDQVIGYEVEAPAKEEKEPKTKINWQQPSNGKSKYRGPGKWH